MIVIRKTSRERQRAEAARDAEAEQRRIAEAAEREQSRARQEAEQARAAEEEQRKLAERREQEATEARELAQQRATEFEQYFGEKVYVIAEGLLYKIRIGNCVSRDEAEALRQKALSMGYEGAFVVSTTVEVH